jgi:hypothetical protein
MSLPPLLASIVGWLRAGYPEGVPQRDYIPLFALLASQLTDDEVNSIGEELASSSDPSSAQAIRDAIEMVTHSEPNDADVGRVRSHLAAGGWPLERIVPPG